MSKYTITIEGDFKKGECEKCPLSLMEYDLFRDDDPHCMAGEESSNCPLEEVEQSKMHKKVTEIYEAIELFEKSKKEDVFVFTNAHKLDIARLMVELELMVEDLKVRCGVSNMHCNIERMEILGR